MLRIHLSQPQKLSETEKKALQALFLQCDEPYFIRNSKYTIQQSDGSNITLSLSRDILRYHRNELNTNSRYAIVRYKALGEGGFGSVYQSSYVCKIASHSLRIKNRQHAIKFISNNAVSAHREYKHAPSKNRLKPPVYIPQHSEHAIVMKYFKHPTLFDLLKKDRKQEKPEEKLSALDRINICIELAKELDKNVHQRGVIHRDLKPENIIAHYNKEKKKWQLTIIDYGLSKASTEDDSNNDIGTIYYSSPEHSRPIKLFEHLIKYMPLHDYSAKIQHSGRHNHFNTNEKSDIYSMGCIFTEILACDRADINNIQGYLDLLDERIFGKVLFENMFIDVPDADLLPKKKIRLLLNDTTHFFHSEREQLESIIDRLQDIKHSLLLSKKLHRYVSVSTPATTRPHSLSAPNFFAATPTHMPQHLHAAKELMKLAHGMHNHQFHHNMEISCKKLKKIISKHKSLIDCHLEAHAPSRPLNRKK